MLKVLALLEVSDITTSYKGTDPLIPYTTFLFHTLTMSSV